MATPAAPGKPTFSTPVSGLLQQKDLTYVGAFRVPAISGASTYQYGGEALMYHPQRGTLFMVGNAQNQLTGEFSIPTPLQSPTLAGLQRATSIQTPKDILQGKRQTIDGSTTQVRIGGHTPIGSSIVVTAWSYYDAGAKTQTKSHFVTAAGVTGPYQVGNGWNSYAPDTTRIAGFVSGYMCPIPAAYQSKLGGTHLTGQGGMISILGRTSSGPSASAFTPTDLGSSIPAPATLLMGYPTAPSGTTLNHPTLGIWGQNGGLYNGTQGFRGMVFPEGSRSVLFFGWGAPTMCYGAGTLDKALDHKPNPAGGIYCYDPSNSTGKGTHGYPPQALVFAYDADDFIKVKLGTMKPWAVRPYATWSFALPFQSKIVNGVDEGKYEIWGAGYDPQSKRIYLSAYESDGAAPLIHVLTLP